MSDVDWKQLVKKIAPTIGAAVGGSVSGGTGTAFGAMGASALADALLGDKDASEERIVEAIRTASPQTLQRLKPAEKQFKNDLKSLGVSPAELGVETPTSKFLGGSSGSLKAVSAISLAVIAGYLAIVLLYLTGLVTIPEGQKELASQLVDPVQLAFGGVMFFWLGSSFGSKKKDPPQGGGA